MPWNPRVEQGGSTDPVGDLLRAARSKMGDGPPPKQLGLIVLALVVLVGLFRSYYQVEPDEVGVVRRFGRYVETTDPGPHFKLPFIESVIKVPVQRQLKMEFGFRTAATGVETTYQPGGAYLLKESLMLTGDLNVAVVEWIVQFKVKDPYAFLFRVRNVDETLRSLSEAAMRSIVGDHSVNEVLTTGRQKVASEAKEVLQSLADRYDAGVDIQQVVLQDVNPPDPVKPSFNEVNEAIQERERTINEAQTDLNRVIPRARGEAEQAIRAAEGYAIERVNRARGEATRFKAIHEEYRRYPDVFRRRLYLETMAEVLPRAGQKVILDDAAKGMMPILRMDPGVGAPAVDAAAAAAQATKATKGGAR